MTDVEDPSVEIARPVSIEENIKIMKEIADKNSTTTMLFFI